MQAFLHHIVQILGELSWYALIISFHDLGGETLHALGSEWWKKRYHFIENTAERPDVTQMIVRLFFPYLRTSVIRGACLRLQEASLSYLGHIKVSKFDDTILGHEQIGTLDISVDYF